MFRIFLKKNLSREGVSEIIYFEIDLILNDILLVEKLLTEEPLNDKL